MFHTQSQTLFREQLQSIRDAGTLKEEHIMTSSQSAKVTLQNKPQEILNFCANNYLGLSNDSKLIDAAKATLDSHGLGLSSVRFICGTQDIHKQLEQSISQFHQTEDTILYPSCFDANGGLFETLLTAEDAVLSDALNHASIIDGIRLCKAKRFRYKHGDMQDLEARLQAAQDCRLRLIATDGVFSMDGFLAKLDQICDLADRYNAMVMI
ncbi:MAG: aminotransferase class I/II-fold pyridoxal phosphate-dependent enzyme, partial [Myxococcota bacterium]